MWYSAHAAICGVMASALGWGNWSFLGTPSISDRHCNLVVSLCRDPESLGPNNRELTPPVRSPADTPAAELDGECAQYRHIRIIKTPRGSAPEWVREAWVGLDTAVRRLSAGRSEMIPRRFGVTSSWRKRFFPWTAPRFQLADFFPVSASKSIEVLQKTEPDAAWWWTENTPHLLHPTARLMFRRDEAPAGTLTAPFVQSRRRRLTPVPISAVGRMTA